MRRPPQAGDSGGNAGKGIGAGRAGEANGRCRRVLLMIGVQDEDAVERAHQHVVHLVFLARHGEHHAHEVRRVVELVARIDEGLPHRVLVTHRYQGGQLGNQADRRNVAMMGIGDVQRVVVEGGEGADDADQHRHRMRIAPEPAEKRAHLLVHHGVLRHRVDELLLLVGRRQLALEQQIADLEEVAVHRELFDGITAIQKFPLVAVDIGNGRGACRGREKAGIVGKAPRFRVQRTDIDHFGADGSGQHGQGNGGRAVVET